jgi:hypothetical protein
MSPGRIQAQIGFDKHLYMSTTCENLEHDLSKRLLVLIDWAL